MRWLKALVIGMGVLILVGLTVVIVTVIHRAANPAKSTPSASRPLPPVIGTPGAAAVPQRVSPFGDRRIVIPAGAIAEEVTSDAQRLIVRLRLPTGKAALLLIDAASGEKIGFITLDDANP